MRNWLVLGHYGGSNTGDDAMLMGLIYGVRNLSDDQLIITYKGDLPEPIRELNVETIPTRFISVFQSLISCYGIIIGGGTHFQDDMSLGRYIRHFRYMSRYVALSLLAKILRKRVLWISMGFGPFFRNPTKWITRFGLWCCNFVTIRDTNSARIIRGWIQPEKIDVTFDLAALLLDQAKPVVLDRKKTDKLILGISATSVKSSSSGGPLTDKVFWERVIEVLRDLIGSNQNLYLRIFTFRGGTRESDVEISNYFYQSLREISEERIELVPYNPDPLITLRMISECQFFIGTRFHSGILAFLAHCNQIFFAYHKKVIDLAQELGCGAHSVIQINDNPNEKILKETINQLINHPDEFRSLLLVPDAIIRARKNIDIINKF
jgi:polysaccharide pyruvyl transferase WcaK-like protein